MPDEQPKKAATAVFIIRIWREWSLTETRWSGRIEQLDTDAAATFHDLSQVVAFLHASGFVNDRRQSPP